MRAARFGQALFDDDKAKVIDNNISGVVTKIAKLIKDSELRLKKMPTDSYGSLNSTRMSAKEPVDNRASRQVVQNMQQLYYTRLSEYTREMRAIEKDYLDKQAEYGA